MIPQPAPGTGAPARRMKREDFNRPTLRVARDLLGKFIVRTFGRRRVSAMITEVEAYRGPGDRACHTFGGRRTPRVEPLYAEGGTAYVYLVYGMHWLLNFSTAGCGKPEGVLVRAVLAEGAPVIGPGRLTRRLKIDKSFDHEDVTRSKRLWVEDRGVLVLPRFVRKGPRIGIDFAGPYWAARPWRFWIDPLPTLHPAAGPRRS